LISLNDSNKNIILSSSLLLSAGLNSPTTFHSLILAIGIEQVVFSHISGWMGNLSAPTFLVIFQGGKKSTGKTFFMQPEVNLYSAVGIFLGGNFCLSDFPLK